jgi:outer membrane receptor for ferrienterochelin and colicins
MILIGVKRDREMFDAYVDGYFRDYDLLSIYVSGQFLNRNSYYGANKSLSDNGFSSDRTYHAGMQYYHYQPTMLFRLLLH